MKTLNSKAYGNTLKLNDHGDTYVELPVDNYQTLALMHYYIAHAIQLIAQTHERHKQGNEMAYVLYYLSHILKSTSPLSECYDLDEDFPDKTL